MTRGVLALLNRSLRVDARSWPVHLSRFGLLIAIYGSLIFALSNSARFGAPGLGFFRAIVWSNIAFMTLLGIGFFSTAISEEKEEDTLGLMQMAGISSLGILLGKIGGRLVQAALLIAIQYPFNMLAVTMGGITGNQIQCAFVGLTSYMLMLTGLGLLCSTIAPRSRTSATLMVLGIFAYLAIPYTAYEIHRFATTNSLLPSTSLEAEILKQISDTCLPLQVDSILSSTFFASPWTTQALSNAAFAGICFVAAWALFAVCNQNPATESSNRGLVPSKNRGLLRTFAPGRPWSAAFLWKDFHFAGGGLGMIIARVVFYALLVGMSLFLGEFWWPGGGQPMYDFQVGLFQVLLMFLVTLEVTILTTRVFYDEIRGQTLAALIMIPKSHVSVFYSKLMGALLTALPGLLYLAAATSLTSAGLRHAGEFFDEPAGPFYLSNFALVPHVAAVLSLYLRWGCIPLAIGVGIGSLFGWIGLFSSFHIGPQHWQVSIATVFAALVCVGCHGWIIYSLPRVAIRS